MQRVTLCVVKGIDCSIAGRPTRVNDVFGQLLLVLLLLGIPSHARLRVASVPPALDVWVDGVWRGISPVWTDELEVGHHAVRVGSRREWQVQPLDTVVVLCPGVTRMVFSMSGTLHIITEPSGATVIENGREIGHSPLFIARDGARQRRFSVRLGDTIFHQWEWIPTPGALTRVTIHRAPMEAMPSRGSIFWHPAALGVASAAMAVVSAVLARKADENYKRYEATADPGRLHTLFGRAQQLDRWASGLWTGFEISAASALIWWIVGS